MHALKYNPQNSNATTHDNCTIAERDTRTASATVAAAEYFNDHYVILIRHPSPESALERRLAKTVDFTSSGMGSTN